MNPQWSLIGILAIVLAQVVRADAPATLPTSQPSPEVLAMVRNLTSDQFSVRESAQKQLIDLGESIIPQLQSILDSGQISDEARARIRGAIHRILDDRKFG